MGEDSSNYDSNMAHPAQRKIQKREFGHRRDEEGHESLTVKAAFFYAYDRLVASIYPEWL